MPRDQDPDLIIGKYIPNLVPRPFTLDRDFIEEIRAMVESAYRRSVEPNAALLVSRPAPDRDKRPAVADGSHGKFLLDRAVRETSVASR